MSEVDRDAKIITTHAGATFSIHLWEDRTRGELWVPTYDSTALAMVNEDFLRTVSNNAVDSGSRSFEFRALRAGSHRLLFEKHMGWKFTAEDRRVYVIGVADGTTSKVDHA